MTTPNTDGHTDQSWLVLLYTHQLFTLWLVQLL